MSGVRRIRLFPRPAERRTQPLRDRATSAALMSATVPTSLTVGGERTSMSCRGLVASVIFVERGRTCDSLGSHLIS